jgi:hypothetical protein
MAHVDLKRMLKMEIYKKIGVGGKKKELGLERFRR